MSENVMGAIIGAVIGNVLVLIWSLWPLVDEVRQHGWRNDR